jgi:hypothetical protein
VLSGTFSREAELAEIRAETHLVLGQIAGASQRLDVLSGQLATAVDKSREAANTLARLEAETRTTRNERAVVGGILTGVGFVVLGPFGLLGGIAANALGIGTLASVDRIDRKLAPERNAATEAQNKVAQLEGQQRGLAAERAKLEQRHQQLLARDAELGKQLPAEGSTLKQIASARRDAKTLLDNGKALLADFDRLEAVAADRKMTAEALQAQLEGEVSQAEQTLAALDRDLHTALFDLCFSVVGAGVGLELLDAGEAAALKAALTGARFFDQPPEARAGALAKLLLGTVTADAGLAGKIAGAVAGAMIDAQTALEKPDAAGSGPIMEAFLKLGPAERKLASGLLTALAPSAPNA